MELQPDAEADNGLLELLRTTSLVRPRDGGSGAFEPVHRAQLARSYSWAIPDLPALRCIAAEAAGRGVLEVGAGTGYWALLLRRMGVDVIATDIAPPRPELGAAHNPWHPGSETFTEVVPMDSRQAAASAGDRVLLLCWPPSTSEMASEAVVAYGGATVVYVGEWSRGTTGTPALHAVLEADWSLDLVVAIPVWWGREDCVRVFRRRALPAPSATMG